MTVHGQTKPTPDGHVIDPDCPALSRNQPHGYWRAHERGCRCPGQSLDAWRAQRAAEDRARRANNGQNDSVTAPPFWSPRVPEVESLGKETTTVLNSDAAACRDEDPELFFPVGASLFAQAQADAAKAVCARCPIRATCLRAALRWRSVGVWGGTTENERRAMRTREQVAA